MNNNKKRTASHIIVGAVFSVLAIVLIVLIILIVKNVRRDQETIDHITENSGDPDIFDELIAINPEVIAWITVDDTLINTCVTQAKDNTKYINTDARGEESFAGNPFLDYRNASDFSDVYSLVYGHLMSDHLMFGDLVLFQDPEFWETERTGTLLLADKREYNITFFACLTATSHDSMYFDPIRVRNNWNGEFLASMLEDAELKNDEIGLTDHILVLSTCQSYDSDERVMVFGKLTEKQKQKW